MRKFISRVPRVTVELSNRCNYSHIHSRCPNSTFSDVKILPLACVKDIVRQLADWGWGEGRKFAFHVFNEPGIDPRLYWLLGYVTKHLPGVHPLLATNGWYLDEGLAEELFEAGLGTLGISVYTADELARLEGLADRDGVMMWRAARLFKAVMKRGDGPVGYKKCFAPLCDLTIRASGNVGLCCLDYDETVVFGNVRQESLGEILAREGRLMEEIQLELVAYKRTIPVCATCHFRRPPDRVP